MGKATKRERLQELESYNKKYSEENQGLRKITQHLEMDNEELQHKLSSHANFLIQAMEELEK